MWCAFTAGLAADWVGLGVRRKTYDADATPEFGTETLNDHYKRLATEDVADDRGGHVVF
jgi:hypothetical protein